MSPLVWDLAHIAAYEDLWLAHRHAGLELLRPDLAELYDAFETPRSRAGRDRAARRPRRARLPGGGPRARHRARSSHEGIGDGVLHELVLRHELQHTETMRQTLAIAGLLPPGDRSKINQPCRRSPARRSWLRAPRRGLRDGRRRRGLRLRQRAPPPPRADRRLRHRAAPRDQRELAALQRGRRLRAARVVVGRGVGVEGGVRHHSPPLDRGRRGGWPLRGRPSATSAGSRPTPSPARTTRGSPRRRSGSGRRPRSSRDWRSAPG